MHIHTYAHGRVYMTEACIPTSQLEIKCDIMQAGSEEKGGGGCEKTTRDSFHSAKIDLSVSYLISIVMVFPLAFMLKLVTCEKI